MRLGDEDGAGCALPKVPKVAGYRFYFYSHEPNEPPHVHIDKGGATAKFWLERVALVRTMGYPPAELGELHRLVREHQAALVEAWHEHFGRNR